jgi:hypothetical protein
MFTRRFLLLAGILVTLNLTLWFAAPGLALPKVVIQQLFGPKMVRAEVLEKNGADWRLDRGVVVSVDSTQVTLKEADGRIQSIPLESTTKVVRLGRHLSPALLAPRWRVLVTWPASGAAQQIKVEHIPRGRVKQGTRLP